MKRISLGLTLLLVLAACKATPPGPRPEPTAAPPPPTVVVIEPTEVPPVIVPPTQVPAPTVKPASCKEGDVYAVGVGGKVVCYRCTGGKNVEIACPTSLKSLSLKTGEKRALTN